MPPNCMYHATGGDLIGQGEFGEVYSDVSDVSDVSITIESYTKDSIELSKDRYSTELENCVFKLLQYQTDRVAEKANNQTLYQLLRGNVTEVTSLHHSILSVRNASDEFLVYRKMQKNLQDYLYMSDDKYLKEWRASGIFVDTAFINNVMKQALQLCSTLHTNNFLHRDIKLDNFLVDATRTPTHVVLSDYGMMMSRSADRTNAESEFLGMPDYMPPFCHYLDNGWSYLDNYTKRMNAIFFVEDGRPSKHPRAYPVDRIVDEVVETYKNPNPPNQFKIDLHPLGIVLLQLCKRANSLTPEQLEYYVDFAKTLMSYDGFQNAIDALKNWNPPQSQGGGSRMIRILGRNRKVLTIKGKEFITYQGKQITLKQAERLSKTRPKPPGRALLS